MPGLVFAGGAKLYGGAHLALYAIGDLHLSLGGDKPMDVFGGRWINYVEKLKDGFSKLGPEDVTVLCGDLSWGMSLEAAREDFLFMDRLPGRKVILKGRSYSRATTTTGGPQRRRPSAFSRRTI